MQRVYIRRRITVGLIALALLVFANNATTPKECKVPVEKMSAFCLEVMFP